MADAQAAIDFVTRQEDSTLSGVITNASANRGGLTHFGLCEKWHPELTAKGSSRHPRPPLWHCLWRRGPTIPDKNKDTVVGVERHLEINGNGDLLLAISFAVLS
jgi:hypothetical protein